jgi:hypothetical protein
VQTDAEPIDAALTGAATIAVAVQRWGPNAGLATVAVLSVVRNFAALTTVAVLSVA